ncbi:MAG: hypothetical protein ABI597_06535 [Gammaproteobacteria bacterium]
MDLITKKFPLLLLCLFISTEVKAWSNSFRFINNFNFPMTITISPSLATVTSTCGISNVTVNPQSPSCEFQFNLAQEKWYNLPANQGTITLTKQTDPSSYCVYNYQYTYTLLPYSFFDIHSEQISLQSCQGNLKPGEISVISDHNQELPRPLAKNIAINIDKDKAVKSTESFSQSDCGGNSGDNCLIASPDLNTVYLPNGSTLAQSITLQNELDRYEPLNFAQFMGSHNSAVSRQYTTSTSPINLSYADPDNYLSITDQLNSGVRQIELDIVWYNNTVTLCHNHISTGLEGILCEGNAPISNAITEIKSWVEKNPSALVIVYLDVNLPLTGKVTNLDSELAKLEPHVFTPALATEYFGVPNNTLPAYQLSANKLIQGFHKNIIITNDDDTNDLQTSQYVFVKVQNSNATPLYESAVDTFVQSNYSNCGNQNKYSNVKNLYANDPNHYNILRMNESRTVLDYVSDSGSYLPNLYVDYYTTQNISNMLNCPINVFSLSLLGFTCDSSSCASHPTDPRLYSFLWSWGLGYPLKNGSNLAYINPTSGHFENNPLVTNTNYSVLCYKKTPAAQTPTAPLQWYLQNVKVFSSQSSFNVAESACRTSGGVFGIPTVAYWMNDAMAVINANGINPYNVLVNYTTINGVWTPNVVVAIESTRGQSLLN